MQAFDFTRNSERVLLHSKSHILPSAYPLLNASPIPHTTIFRHRLFDSQHSARSLIHDLPSSTAPASTPPQITSNAHLPTAERPSRKAQTPLQSAPPVFGSQSSLGSSIQICLEYHSQQLNSTFSPPTPPTPYTPFLHPSPTSQTHNLHPNPPSKKKKSSTTRQDTPTPQTRHTSPHQGPHTSPHNPQ